MCSSYFLCLVFVISVVTIFWAEFALEEKMTAGRRGVGLGRKARKKVRCCLALRATGSRVDTTDNTHIMS